MTGGDERALRALYDELGGRVLATAQRILGSAGEAEEIVRDTFIDVWNRADRFDPARGPAAAWVLTLARNRAIDRLRARASSPRPPDQKTEEAERRGRVAEALGALPPDQRAVVELAFYGGLSQAEIAARTGHPLGTIKERARAALQKLAELLGKESA